MYVFVYENVHLLLCVWTSEGGLECCSSSYHFYMGSGDPNAQGIRYVWQVFYHRTIFKKIIIYFVVCMNVHATVCLCKLKDNLSDLMLYPVGSGY